MNKELEALKNIKREAGTPYFSSLYDIDDWKNNFQIIEKALKALEIIKNRIACDFYIEYWYVTNEINDEAKDLLKEVLL